MGMGARCHRLAAWALATLLGVLGCAGRPARHDVTDLPPEALRATQGDRTYGLTWAGAAIGIATEAYQLTETGARLRRVERLRYRRGPAVIETDLQIVIDARPDGQPILVEVVADGGDVMRLLWGTDGWRDDDGQWWAPSDAVPSEWVPVATRGGASWQGPVILSASGPRWQVHQGVVAPGAGEGQVVARFADPAGRAIGSTAVALAADGWPDALVADDGTAARRLAPGRVPSLPAQDALADVVWLGGFPADDAGAARSQISWRRSLAGTVERVWVTAEPAPPPGLATLIHDVRAQLAPDLAVQDAAGHGRGDCTAFALAVEAAARARGLAGSIETGYVRDQGRWTRHRWNRIVYDGRAVNVDASEPLGESPRLRWRVASGAADAASLAVAGAAFAEIGSPIDHGDPAR